MTEPLSHQKMESSFAFFGLPEKYHVDLEVVRERRNTLLGQSHPDRGGSAGEAAAVNRHFHILSDDLARARHLLELRGCEWGEGAMPPANPALNAWAFDVHGVLATADEEGCKSLLCDISAKKAAASQLFAAGDQDEYGRESGADNLIQATGAYWEMVLCCRLMAKVTAKIKEFQKYQQ